MSYDDRLGRGVANEIRSVFVDALELLEECLRKLRSEQPDFTTHEGRLRCATALLARNVYGEGKASIALYDANVGRQIPSHVRTQFEAAVKLEYLERHKERLVDFFDVEPFERHFMALERTTLRKEIRDAIEHECDEVIRRRPDLLKHEKDAEAIRAGKLKPDYRRLYHKLKLPKVSSMIDQLNHEDPGWNRDLYTVIFRVGSLGTHSSIVSLRDAYVEDGSGISVDISQRWEGAPDYLLQGTNYLLGFTHKVLQHCRGEDSSLSEPLRRVVERHQVLARKLGAIT